MRRVATAGHAPETHRTGNAAGSGAGSAGPGRRSPIVMYCTVLVRPALCRYGGADDQHRSTGPDGTRQKVQQQWLVPGPTRGAVRRLEGPEGHAQHRRAACRRGMRFPHVHEGGQLGPRQTAAAASASGASDMQCEQEAVKPPEPLLPLVVVAVPPQNTATRMVSPASRTSQRPGGPPAPWRRRTRTTRRSRVKVSRTCRSRPCRSCPLCALSSGRAGCALAPRDPAGVIHRVMHNLWLTVASRLRSVIRSGLSLAASSRLEATSRPTPLRAVRAGATCSGSPRNSARAASARRAKRVTAAKLSSPAPTRGGAGREQLTLGQVAESSPEFAGSGDQQRVQLVQRLCPRLGGAALQHLEQPQCPARHRLR